MKRSAIVTMETSLNQEEFEKWLLGLMKAVAVVPEKTQVESFIRD